MNDRPTLDEIRARCALPVTEIVANPGEYYRVQTILRDRAELLRLLDERTAERDSWRSAREDLASANNRMAPALRRAVELLRIGIDDGLDGREKDEANALILEFGYGSSFIAAMREIIGVDMAKGPDWTVITPPPVTAEEMNKPFGPADGSGDWSKRK
jgi:hypothetical protein